MVWLKIRRHDIWLYSGVYELPVVVWLKIRRHDIQEALMQSVKALWFD